MENADRWEGRRPYAYPGNVMSIISRFRSMNLPGTLPPHALIAAGVPEGNVSRTLDALQFLGLLNKANEPTDKWHALADATPEEFPGLLGRLVQAAYADSLEYVDPSTDPYPRIEAAFQRFNPKSQHKRMATLMLALFDAAGMEVLDRPKRRPTKAEGLGTGALRRRERIGQPNAGSAKRAEELDAEPEDGNGADSAPPTVDAMRARYAEALLKHVAQAQAEPSPELLNRIERMLGIAPNAKKDEEPEEGGDQR